MNITLWEVLDRLEAEVADLGCALSGMAEMLNNTHHQQAGDVFGSMAKNAGGIITSIEYWREELKADNEAQLASIEPHHPESTSHTEVQDEGTD
jgi:hypothetical protein